MWSAGSTFLMWFGPTARIVIEESDLIREIFFSNSVAYDKYESHPLVRQLEGDGLLGLSGEKWAHHRKVVSKVFNSENLKVCVHICRQFKLIGPTLYIYVCMLIHWRS